jgi:hypothetical protein
MEIERDKSWRRLQKKLNGGKGMGSKEEVKPEKKWKFMYLREDKLARARQLGFSYPRRSGRQLLDQENPLNEQ